MIYEQNIPRAKSSIKKKQKKTSIMVRFLKYIFFHIACDNRSIRKLILAKINLLKKWNWHYFTLLVMDLLSPSKYFIWNKAKRANLKTGIRRKQSKTNFPKNEHFLILATPVLRFALLFYYRRFELVKLLIVSNIQLYFMLNNSPIIFIVASEKRYIVNVFFSVTVEATLMKPEVSEFWSLLKTCLNKSC